MLRHFARDKDTIFVYYVFFFLISFDVKERAPTQAYLVVLSLGSPASVSFHNTRGQLSHCFMGYPRDCQIPREYLRL